MTTSLSNVKVTDGTNETIVKADDITIKGTSVTTSLSNKQETLVSGTNIKTINSTSILGSGNIVVDSLPSQSGQSGKYLTTNGTSASWASVDALPSQTSQSGKYLTTNGTSASWADVPTELPTQTGQNGKYLTTNGSSVSWASVDALPSQTSQSGKFLTTNGTTASWASITIPTLDNKSITTNGSSQWQAVGTINQRDNSTALKYWSGTKAQYTSITTKDSNTIYNVTDEESSISTDNFVTTNTTQSITGAKTFTGNLIATTQANSDNSTKVATTAYVNNKLQVVSSLPASPDANVFYFVTGS